MLNVNDATALKKILTNTNFKKKVYLEGQKAQKAGRCLRGRHIAYMVYGYFRIASTHESVLDFSDLMNVFEETCSRVFFEKGRGSSIDDRSA